MPRKQRHARYAAVVLHFFLLPELTTLDTLPPPRAPPPRGVTSFVRNGYVRGNGKMGDEPLLHLERQALFSSIFGTQRSQAPSSYTTVPGGDQREGGSARQSHNFTVVRAEVWPGGEDEAEELRIRFTSHVLQRSALLGSSKTRGGCFLILCFSFPLATNPCATPESSTIPLCVFSRSSIKQGRPPRHTYDRCYADVDVGVNLGATSTSLFSPAVVRSPF